jgi:hypothetical protein
VTFQSSPPGIDLVVGDTLERAPFSRQLIRGATTFLSAPASQTVNGITYRFGGWSDGQAQNHTLAAPPESTTYAARYAAVAPGTQTVVLSPEADVYAAEGLPNTNLGQSWVLRTAGGTNTDAETYLRFLVDGLVGKVQSAKLRLFATKATTSGPRAFATAGNWSELGLTWNNRPAASGPMLDDAGPIPDAGWVEWDVSPAITGAGPQSFLLSSTTSDAAKFEARESAEILRLPELVVTIANDGYARPKGATPALYSLVTAYDRCISPTRTHGAPLAVPSCAPPAQSSTQLTVGSADSNGKPANSIGSVLYTLAIGNPATPQDEADLQLKLHLSDVRERADLSDYGGELGLLTTVRASDRLNGAGQDEPATVSDFGLTAVAPCVPTADAGTGAVCDLVTTVEASVPGAVREGSRAVWELGQVQVSDGGADGDADTAPNKVFARQGVFVP